MSSILPLIVRCDGGSRGNPGPGASAFVVYENKKIIYSKSYYFENTTNNVAEYFAVLMAATWISKNQKGLISSDVTFLLDSELVVKQLTGVYKIKNLNLLKIANKIKKLIKEHDLKLEFKHIRREFNKDADALVNQEMDENLG